jgi:4-aminobutyrate aminotransferase-like enzyme
MSTTESMVNAFRPGAAVLAPEEQLLVDRRERLLGPAYRLFYEKPLHLVRGEGVWLYDSHGEAYLDAYNNVASLGHCHPKVVEAVTRQFATLNTHTRYLHRDILNYAEDLLSSFASGLENVMFTCTGSEANDLAMRIATAATGGTGVIVTENAYHGVTSMMAGMSPSLGPANLLGPHVWCVPAPGSGDDTGKRFTDGIKRALAGMALAGVVPALMIADTIFSSDGVYADPPGFLKEAVTAVQDAGALFVADEVQPGFARTGDRMWGFQRHGISPDMVTLGKPMGNGYPVAGLVIRRDLLEEFGRRTRYFNTFGGNATAVAAAHAVWNVIRDDGLLESARSTGAYFRKSLAALSDHECIGEIRGAGLFLAVDIRHDNAPWPEGAARIVNGLRDRHVLISATGKAGDTLKIRPPLVFRREHVDMFIERLSETLIAL